MRRWRVHGGRRGRRARYGACTGDVGRARRLMMMTMAVVGGILMPVLSMTSAVMASRQISEEDLRFYNMNRIYFYDGDRNGKGKGSGRTCSGTLSGSNVFEKMLSYLLSVGLTDVAAAGVYGNMMAEGFGGGTLLRHEEGMNERADIGTTYRDAYGNIVVESVSEHDVRDLDNPNIIHGLGPIQWSLTRRVNLLKALDEAGVGKYAREWDDVNGRYVYDRMPYDEMVQNIGQNETDELLFTIMDFFNSEHENYMVTGDDVAAQGLEEKYGIKAGMVLYDAINMMSDPYDAAQLFFSVSEMPLYTKFDGVQARRGENARNGYDIIQNAGVTGDGSMKCSDSIIVDTALTLAWDRAVDGNHGPSDPKPEYVEAMRAVSTGGALWDGKGNQAPEGASCDQFVSTVMRYSGADADFPHYGPLAQMEHMLRHPEMYEEIENLMEPSNLEPGDVFVVSSSQGRHIFIFMGIVDGQWMQASASFGGRTGEYFAFPEYIGHGAPYRIFRWRKPE